MISAAEEASLEELLACLRPWMVGKSRQLIMSSITSLLLSTGRAFGMGMTDLRMDLNGIIDVVIEAELQE